MRFQAPTDARDVPVLIFAPGLGKFAGNTADQVADAIALTIDTLDDSSTYATKLDANTTAPRGLRAGKAIVTPDGAPVLQVFELDYKPLLDPGSGPAGPPVVSGMIRSSSLAALALVKLVYAWRRPAKGARAKAQLLMGLLTAFALVFVALMSVYAALVAMGVELPLATKIFGPDKDAANWTFGVSALGLTITWTALRKKILALAATAERTMRFVRNDDAVADTVAKSVDRGVDGLRANGWRGSVHLVGYSFGSMAVFEAMFPRKTSLLSNRAVKNIASLVTIGCPIDLVRLYDPGYLSDRIGRRPDLPWTNIFNGADLFASNLDDSNDSKQGPMTLVSPSGAEASQLKAKSIRYLRENLSVWRLLITGRIHAGYWGVPERANCFDELVNGWIPETPEPAPSGALAGVTS